ncbi:hypothetical protein PN36_32720 [Candidatus Thiomargarita nelsonii]|uniref:Uncharacterized protein n=1 Tax=Candidatus Thiomargarita nelsonii TaxID=1003181 RepID=A0A4E0QX81_9GAMM|nr:hypothetical protein PN36_32720 [Candidatus Thiomargarita nelsonii]
MSCEAVAIISSPFVFGLVIITLFSVLREKEVIIGVKMLITLIKLAGIIFALSGLLLQIFGDSNELRQLGMSLFITAQSFIVVALSTLAKRG